MPTNDIKFNVDTAQALAKLNELGNKAAEVGDKFGKAFNQISGYATALAAALVAAGTTVAQFADEITDVAAANKMAVADVLAFSAALGLSGGKADQAGTILQRLVNNIDDVNSGNLKTLSTFQKLGITIEDLGSLSQSAIKDKILDNLAKMKDPVEQSALAFQLFGKAMTGVEIEKFAAQQKAMRAEMEQYTPSLESAGAAWDNLAMIGLKAKLAFADVFKPVFDWIAKLNPSVEELGVKFKILAAGLAIMTSAATIAGLAKIVELMKVLTVVVSRNPIVAILGALVSLGVGMATYVGLTKDAEDAQKSIDEEIKKTVDSTDKRKNSQQGLNDALKKELSSLQQIRETLEKNWKISSEKFDLEVKSLSLTEDQKKAAQEVAKIQEDSQNALFNLKQKFEAMDSDARARQQKAYEDERNAIITNAETEKKAVEDRIMRLEEYKSFLKDLQAMSTSFNDAEQKMFESRAKASMDLAGYKERIDIEAKLTALTQTRTALLQAASQVSEQERSQAIEAIGEATTNTELLAGSYEDINNKINEYIQLQVKMGSISQETANKILSTTAAQRIAIAVGAQAVANSNKEITDQSRTFSYGWQKAFAEYADNANNAARQASVMFQKFTQGMEDMIVNFAKTGKFEWKNFLASMVEELLRSNIRQLMSNMFAISGAGGGGGGGGSILGSIWDSIFGRAIGGPVQANQPYIVGERGPELFVPASAGQVVANGALSSTPASTTVVNYNINAVDAPSFKAMIAKDPSFIYAVSMMGAKTMPGAR